MQIDWEELEQEFRASDGKKATKAADKGPKTVSLLSSKRAQAVSIFLKSSRMTPQEITDAVLTMDSNRMTPEWTQLLVGVLPDESETKELERYLSGNDASLLGPPERFFIHIGSIPYMRPRLEALLAHMTLPMRIEESAPKVAMVREAIQQIETSERWTKLLECVMTVGNFVNSKNKNRANAAGVRVSSLANVGDTKSVDGKGNLLQYVARLIGLPHVLRDGICLGSHLLQLSL